MAGVPGTPTGHSAKAPQPPSRRPIPSTVMYLTTIWILSPFTPETGTIIIPGSHRSGIDPQGDGRADGRGPHPTEMRVSAGAGSVSMFDSRMWHAKPNHDGTGFLDRPR